MKRFLSLMVSLMVFALLPFTLCAQTNVSNAYVTATNSTTTRTLGARTAEVFNVKDYGAAGNGVADDTSAVQAAINKAASLGGGTVYLPAGTYKLTATLTVSTNGVKLAGAGMYQTILTRSADYGDILVLTGNDATGVLLQNTGLSDVTIRSTAQTTSGTSLKINGILRGDFRNIYIEQGFIAIGCYGATSTTLRNVNVLMNNLYGGSASGRRVLVCSDAAATYSHRSSGDLFVSDFNFRADATADIGVLIETADGIWFQNGHVGWAVTANTEFSNISGGSMGDVFFNNVMFDSYSTVYNVYFTGGSSRGRFIQFNNCQMAGNSTGTYGVIVAAESNFSQVLFNACKIFQHTLSGVELRSVGTYRFDFIGCQIFGNNTSNTAGTSGFLSYIGVGSFSIIGGSAGGIEGSTTYQRYGIDIGSGAGDDINVIGVDTSLNTTAGLRSFATGDNVHLVNNFDGSTNTVASATSIDLPLGSNLVTVTGTTTINNITALGRGQTVILTFSGICTLKDSIGNLKLAGDFTSAADSTLSLTCDGTYWLETARSTN